MLLLTCQNGYHQKDENYDDGMKKGNFHALLMGIQTGAATIENHREVLQKNQKYNYHTIQQFYFWVFI